MNHDEVIEDWKRHAESRNDKHYAFLRSLKFPPRGVKPDQLAVELHEEAFKIVDCTRCANCCKALDTTFSREDIGRIAAHLEIPEREFIDRYLESADEQMSGEPPREGEPRSYKARVRPCPFLGEDDRCTIYEVRPDTCREYPHTDKEGFVHRTMGVANNALACPAVYYIIERMRERVRSRRRR
ncbi:MAG: YkgJ family cysteine cluster protein [Pirellulales bacterium]